MMERSRPAQPATNGEMGQLEKGRSRSKVTVTGENARKNPAKPCPFSTLPGSEHRGGPVTTIAAAFIPIFSPFSRSELPLIRVYYYGQSNSAPAGGIPSPAYLPPLSRDGWMTRI